MTLWARAQELAERDVACVLVTVTGVRGSAPREEGARMLVWKTGQAGTVGGGNLEYTLAEQARRMLDGGEAMRLQEYPLGPLLGQCCGGAVQILLERIDTASRGWLGDFARATAKGEPFTLSAEVGATGVHRALLPDAAPAGEGQPVILRDGVRAATGIRFGTQFKIVECVNANRPKLIMFGAGHVGQAVAAALSALPFDISWFDTRPELAPTPNLVIDADPVARVGDAPADSYFLVFTHSHALDYELVRAVLARGDFRYCGLIGSATKRTRFERRLAEDGIAKAQTARLTCPIGAIGLKSREPAVIAVGVAAELLLKAQEQESREQSPARRAHGG